MSKATDDPTDSGAPVHIDAALIEAERQVRDLLTEANKVPSDNAATDTGKQVWIVIDPTKHWRSTKGRSGERAALIGRGEGILAAPCIGLQIDVGSPNRYSDGQNQWSSGECRVSWCREERA